VGRVIFDGLNMATRRQNRFAHGSNIEPPVSGSFEGAIVEIETVDIDDGEGHGWRMAESKRPTKLSQAGP